MGKVYALKKLSQVTILYYSYTDKLDYVIFRFLSFDVVTYG